MKCGVLYESYRVVNSFVYKGVVKQDDVGTKVLFIM